jgi:hypothetical protein
VVWLPGLERLIRVVDEVFFSKLFVNIRNLHQKLHTLAKFQKNWSIISLTPVYRWGHLTNATHIFMKKIKSLEMGFLYRD